MITKSRLIHKSILWLFTELTVVATFVNFTKGKQGIHKFL